jgi:hypothetical protein
MNAFRPIATSVSGEHDLQGRTFEGKLPRVAGNLIVTGGGCPRRVSSLVRRNRARI